MSTKKPDPKPDPKKASAATAVAAPKAKSNVPAPVHDYGELTGAGFENTSQDDFSIPYLSLLQAMSPECGAEGEEKQIEGAKPGMLMNSVTKHLYPKAGIVFVPVATDHVFVEWRPRDAGGGIVARHSPNSELVTAVKAAQEFGQYKTDDGNDLIETFYMIGFTLEEADATEPGEPIVIAFSSTKIKVYKTAMSAINMFKGKPPLFANRLLVQSIADQNNKGNFFNLKLSPVNGSVGESLIPATLDGEIHPLLLYGKQLNEAWRLGKKRMADESVSGSAPSGGEGGKGLF